MMVSNSEPLPEGTVIMADDQFAGRGQQDNVWHSAAGLNLTFSIFLKPSFLPLSSQFMLNIAVSTGVCAALDTLIPQGVKVKWPNDIYHENRKLGGVLIENTIVGNAMKTSIIGIGINVNQTGFDIEKVKYGTSVREILQQDVNLLKLLSEICLQVERRYFLLKSCSYECLLEEYLSKLYRFGQRSFYRDNTGVFEGVISRVNENGQLVIGINDEERSYNFKEVEFII